MLIEIDKEEPLFTELTQYHYHDELAPEWWVVLRKDDDIQVVIRGNSIDALYHGEAVVKGLRWTAETGYTATIKEKYLYHPDSDDYDDFPLELLPELLPRIKNRIAGFYPSDSRQGRMSTLINDGGVYLDFFAQFGKQGIDLVKIDNISKKIVFQFFIPAESVLSEHNRNIENTFSVTEIKKILSDYTKFIARHEKELMQYYSDVAFVKRSIGVLPYSIWNSFDDKDLSIELNPELIISDYPVPYTGEDEMGQHIKAITAELIKEKVAHSFKNIYIDGYLFKKHLNEIPLHVWISVFKMIPRLEEIEKIDPAETATDHRGKRTRPLKYVRYKSASVQIIGRCFKLTRTHFDWTNWEYGKELLSEPSNTFAGLDTVTLCKLLTILLYYKKHFTTVRPLIQCSAHDLEDGRVLKILKALKENFYMENHFLAHDIRV